MAGESDGSFDQHNEPLPTVFRTSSFDPVARISPDKRLDRLRRECPVLHDPQIGGYFLTRRDDVRAALRNGEMFRNPDKADPATGSLKRMDLRSPGDGGRYSLLLLDEPDHTRVREPLARALNARIARCRPLVSSIVDACLDRLSGKQEFDAVADFADLVPVRVIAGIIGVEAERADEFKQWSDAAILWMHPMRSAAATARMQAANQALNAYFGALIASRRAEPRDDLVSDLVALQAQGAEVDDLDLQMSLRTLIVAGNTTTADLIGNMLWLLLSHPAELNKLQENPELITAAVEEALRCEPPFDVTTRITSDAMDIGDARIGARQFLALSLRAANHDGDVFTSPHEFVVDRREGAHVAFGSGARACLGAPLARIEAQIAVLGLVQKYPDLRLTNPDSPPQWRSTPPLRGLASLPVGLSARGAHKS
jgi:cytochrome P450